MGEYDVKKPPHGRSEVKVSTGSQRATAPPRHAAPHAAAPAATTAPAPSPSPTVNMFQALRAEIGEVHGQVATLQQQLTESSEQNAKEADAPRQRDLSELSGAAKAARRYGTPLIWLASAVGTIFSAGIAWALFVGENATDNEVDTAVTAAVSEHNGGDPEEVGPHPELVTAIQDLNASDKKQNRHLAELAKSTADLAAAQARSNLQARYQFEFVRWQADVLNCVRNRCKPPRKPKKLSDLESQLINGPQPKAHPE